MTEILYEKFSDKLITRYLTSLPQNLDTILYTSWLTEEHGCKLVYCNIVERSMLRFEQEEDYVLFLLRWS